MIDEPDPNRATELYRIHQSIIKHGYALTTEWEIGLPFKYAKNIQGTYFDGGQLRCDKGDQPHDRGLSPAFRNRLLVYA